MSVCTLARCWNSGTNCATAGSKVFLELRARADGEGGTGASGSIACLVSLLTVNNVAQIDHFTGYNYLAFDVIGDLAFGSPFGMIRAGQDSAPVAKNFGKEGSMEIIHIPAVKILNDRGEYSASMGVLPPWLRPLIKNYHPWYRNGAKAVTNLAGIAVAAVSKRLATPTDRADLLSKLQQGKDDEGKPMGIPELTAEALTQLIAGSDTTSKSVNV